MLYREIEQGGYHYFPNYFFQERQKIYDTINVPVGMQTAFVSGALSSQWVSTTPLAEISKIQIEFQPCTLLV
jgi:hypothetical protein